MMRRMSRYAAAALTALGIALAPAAASAQNRNDDLAKIIAGLAIAGIVAKAIDDRKDRKKKAAAAQAQSQAKAGRNLGGDYYYDRDGRRVIDGTIRRDGDYRHGGNGHGWKRRPLPDQCLRIVETARGDRRAYSKRCLNRNYRFADRLPESCETLVRTPRGFRAVYGTRCLSRQGFRVAGR